MRYHLARKEVPCRMWSMGVFAQGDLTMEALEREMRECSFVVLVATKDDMTKKRGAAKLAPRDNVVLEYGMGLGRLGRERTFLLVPDDFTMHLPSDLAGLTLGGPDLHARLTSSSMQRWLAQGVGGAEPPAVTGPRSRAAEKWFGATPTIRRAPGRTPA